LTPLTAGAAGRRARRPKAKVPAPNRHGCAALAQRLDQHATRDRDRAITAALDALIGNPERRSTRYLNRADVGGRAAVRIPIGCLVANADP
jgi:hypothetical protein